MGRKSFFDALERVLNLQKEYEITNDLILTTTNWCGRTLTHVLNII